MRRQIPSMAALESFEAVVRSGSVTTAASELGRTQSAISRQLLALEQFLRRPLFAREHNRMTVNEAGRYYYEVVTNVLDKLEQTSARTMVFGAAQQRILIRTLPTFGARWLIPRLSNFPSEKLGIELTLTTGVGPVFDFQELGIDAAVQYGTGGWANLASYQLLREETVAVVSPDALATRGPDIRRHDWLHMITRPRAWRKWTDARLGSHIPVPPGLKFENFHMLIEAACLGYGVALVPTPYVESELASGRLAAPFGDPIASGYAYYLCFRGEDAEKPAFSALRGWLLRDG